MSLTLATDRLTLIALLGDDRSPILPRLFQASASRDAEHIAVRGQTVAQRNILAAQIDAAVVQADRAVMLIAQGTGCMAAAWWARLSPKSYVSRIAGAVMIAPEQSLAETAGFASPRCVLPFPSIVVGYDDATQRLAGEWGSRLIDGPLTIDHRPPSGRFVSMIERFTAAIVERDVSAAERLLQAVGDR